MVKKAFKLLIRLLVCALVLLGLAATLVIYTESGRIRLAETGLTFFAAESGRYRVQWSGLRSPAADQWYMDRLDVYFDDINIMSAASIEVDWWPGTLLIGEVLVERVRIGTLGISNLDIIEPDSESSDPPGIRITVVDMTVNSFVTDYEQVVDIQPLRLQGELTLFTEDNLLESSTDVHAAGEQFTASISIQVDNTGLISLAGSYSEPPSGPAGNLIKQDPDLPIEASVAAVIRSAGEDLDIDIRDLALGYHQHEIVANGSVQFTAGQYLLRDVTVYLDASRHKLTGIINEGGLNLDIVLDALPLAALPGISTYPVTGSINGAVNISGTPDDHVISLDVVADSRYASLPLSLAIKGNISGTVLTLDQVMLASPAGLQASLSGNTGLDDNSVNLLATIIELDLLALRDAGTQLPDELAGSIQGTAVISGTLQEPLVHLNTEFLGSYAGTTQLRLDLDGTARPVDASPFTHAISVDTFDINIDNHRLTGSADADVSLSPLNLAIRSAHLDIGGLEHPLTGTIVDEELSLVLSLNRLPLETFASFLPVPVSGHAHGTLELTGTTALPMLEGDLESSLTYRALTSQVTTRFNAMREQLHINEFKAVYGSGSLLANGTLSMAGDTHDLHVQLNELDMTTVSALGMSLPAAVKGSMQGEINISGTRSQPHATGTIGISGSYGEVPVQLSVTGDGWLDNFRIENMGLKTDDGGYLDASGNYDDDDFIFEIQAGMLPAGLFQYGDWRLPDGTVSASFSARGSSSDPLIHGSMNYRRKQSSQLVTGLDAVIQLADNRLGLTLTPAGDSERSGSLQVSLPWRHYIRATQVQTDNPIPLQGSVNGRADLSEICRLLLNNVIHTCGGDLNTDINLAGDSSNPLMRGKINLTGGFYDNSLSGTELQDILININAVENRLDIVEARASDGGIGQFRLTGSGSWDRVRRSYYMNLILDVDNAHVLRRYDMDGTGSGSLVLQGNQEEMLLDGSMDVTPFTLYLDNFLREEIPALHFVFEEPENPNRAGEDDYLVPDLQLDLVLAAQQQAFLRGPGLEAELAGELLVQGTRENPIFRGTFRTIRGSLHVFGKRFELDQGQLRLEDDIYSFLIPATYQGREIEVRAELSGTQDDMKLALSSVPVLSEDEIISHLLFGKSTQSISPLQAVRLANAITMFRRGGKPLFDPLGRIEKTLSLDRLTVEEGSTENSLVVGAGKYVHEKVYVEVERDTRAGEAWQGNVEIELRPNLNLENTINSESGFGNMGIQWKKDY